MSIKSKFLSDLKVGKQGELIVSEYFMKIGGSATPSESKEYDLIVGIGEGNTGGYILSVEVKYDLFAQRTGNIAIEFFNPKTAKPSGINVCEADFWCHVLSDKQIWISSLDKLRHFCDTEEPYKIVDGGDDNASLMLFKKESILGPCMTRIDTLTKEDFLCLFKSF